MHEDVKKTTMENILNKWNISLAFDKVRLVVSFFDWLDYTKHFLFLTLVSRNIWKVHSSVNNFSATLTSQKTLIAMKKYINSNGIRNEEWSERAEISAFQFLLSDDCLSAWYELQPATKQQNIFIRTRIFTRISWVHQVLSWSIKQHEIYDKISIDFCLSQKETVFSSCSDDENCLKEIFLVSKFSTRCLCIWCWMLLKPTSQPTRNSNSIQSLSSTQSFRKKFKDYKSLTNNNLRNLDNLIKDLKGALRCWERWRNLTNFKVKYLREKISFHHRSFSDEKISLLYFDAARMNFFLPIFVENLSSEFLLANGLVATTFPQQPHK